MRTIFLLSALAAALPCGAEGFTKAELSSLYYADLGPSEIDVSSYSKKQQENYALTRQVCTQCHAFARTVNSPTVSRGAWEYYVFKMRLRSKFAPGTGYTPEQAKDIVDFLAYDSGKRKEKRREEFDELTRKLQKRFGETVEERMHRLQEGNPKLKVPR